MTKPKPPSKAPPPRLSSSSSSVDIDGSMDLLHPSSIIQDPALAEALSSVLSNVTYREEEATPKNSNRKTSSATDDKPLTTDSNSNSNSNVTHAASALYAMPSPCFSTHSSLSKGSPLQAY
mmetsp:Transcript_20402/g.42805  ORF Transcript_20402/g.42805 Transcript_20402/m.42805 type:complete len:121 (+) Transcript_20402:158-520(+)